METEESRQAFFKIFYLALIEIRERAAATNESGIYKLADLFHNAAWELGRQGDDQADFAAILARMRERARETGSEEWLDNALGYSAGLP